MLKFVYILSCVFLFNINLSAQQVDLMTSLHSSIKETSGLIFINEKIITHNDSGGEPELYEIDSISGNIIRTVRVQNATNVDWEDITFDDTYIYIGDFGNNTGARTNLMIYRLSRLDFFNTPNDTVMVDTILFNYTDQIDFTSTSYATNFDAEALIAFNDSLYVFTKNWGDHWTNIYPIPKVPGNYQVDKLDSINSMGLVTGATVSTDTSSIVLCGYAGIVPFIIELNQFVGSDFSGSNMLRYDIVQPSGYSVQIEGITALNHNQYYLSSEEFLSGDFPGLYKLTMDDLLSFKLNKLVNIKVSPNPVINHLSIECTKNESLEIMDAFGQVIRIVPLTSGANHIAMELLPKGIYFLRFTESSIMKRIILQ